MTAGLDDGAGGTPAPCRDPAPPSPAQVWGHPVLLGALGDTGTHTRHPPLLPAPTPSTYPKHPPSPPRGTQTPVGSGNAESLCTQA